MDQPSIVDLHPGALFHGRYRVVRRIKAGSMGAIYEVADDKTRSRRALKVMLPDLIEDPDLRSRFELEAQVTGDIESDHLVRVSDAGIDETTGTPFISLPQAFDDWLRKATAPRPEERFPGLVITGDGEEMKPASWNKPVLIDKGLHALRVTATGKQVWSRDIESDLDGNRVRIQIGELRDLALVKTAPPSRPPEIF